MAVAVSRRQSSVNFVNRPRVSVSEPGFALGSEPTVVALRGELDAAALTSLVGTFDDALGRDDADVVIDLADVSFIGAAWIGTFVRSRAELHAQDRELTLRAPSRVVIRLLELCGLLYLTDVAVEAPVDSDAFQTQPSRRRDR